jgi:hypothetical protein
MTAFDLPFAFLTLPGCFSLTNGSLTGSWVLGDADCVRHALNERMICVQKCFG